MCTNLQAKILFKIDTVWTFLKIISIPDEEYFPKRPSGTLLYTLLEYYHVPVSFVTHLIWGSVLLY